MHGKLGPGQFKGSLGSGELKNGAEPRPPLCERELRNMHLANLKPNHWELRGSGADYWSFTVMREIGAYLEESLTVIKGTRPNNKPAFK